ncbi:RNA polymerase sporulation sigma factor SigK [Tissierella creatinophila]|uniref:RNA polymerase sigma factor n=1 Tax=Tissierella creatinophila DSM 6911 TaxID=1123403 RepID=A0A1U7M9F8_TISCR|nr:RNA polymerase sporulation sigma factor SigK [Tissierella creatinophila]OLS03916.1 RNA polymerase sigma-28 factor precursor [Tissierella creatinophila DSM 6911]
MENTLYLILSVIFRPFIVLCGYMINSNAFPKPLNREEEQRYLQLHSKGDKAAKDILVERNLRLVAHMVKKYHNTGRDVEDLISIGTIGLIKGIDTFKADKGARLATYAARCIDNEILMSIRQNKKTQMEVSLHDPVGSDKEGNEINLLDILGTDPDEVIDKVDLKFETKKLYNCMDEILGKREKIIVQLRYGLIDGDYKTQREIAEILKISRSYVSRIESRALNKLSRAMEK